ncbi:branched-chain amino acid ABC transporter substrate-binding protein, partial [Frankia sp. Cpl3]|nr:branched-chain amino acid ABC transporter substrate-binding protein [Frankia sp. Cpl3]
MIIRKALAVTAAAGLLSAALVACGGDGDSDSTDTAGLTGAPITVEVITTLNSVTPHTESYEGAQAAAAAVNASG